MKKVIFIVLFGIISTLGFTQNASLEWAKQMGGTSSDYGFCIKTDVSGNIYTIGNFRDTVDFDPGAGVFNLISNGNMDIFIQKLAPNGNFIWAKQIGGTGLDDGKSIAIDPSGYIYSTGIFNGTVDINPGVSKVNLTSNGNHDIFIQKLDTAGNFVWAKQMGGPFVDFGNSITLDAIGNVYTTGYFRDTVDFDPGAGVVNLTSAGNTNINIFIQKLAANGNFVWAKQMNGTSLSGGVYITADAGNNIYLTGFFRDTVDFDPGTGVFNLISNGGNDVFIQKLDANGNLVWVKQMGGTMVDYGYSIATDMNGNVYSTGYFRDTADFDPGPGVFNLISDGNTDVYVQKLTTNGNFEWAKQIGSGAADGGTSIIVDTSENTYVTGYFQNTADFDPSSGVLNLTSNGLADIFIQKFAANGTFLWAKQLGGTAFDIGRSLTSDARGDLYVTGSFGDTVDFDPGMDTLNFTSIGSTDIFIQKLNQCYTSAFGTDTRTECSPYVWIDGNTYTTNNNTARDTIISGATNGCDSVVTLNLTITVVDTSITSAGTYLTANGLSAAYQWLDCNNNFARIPSATARTYYPNVNGSYALEITSSNCTDTSSCYAVIGVGLSESANSNSISISPNPATNKLTITTSNNIKIEQITILDSRGSKVRVVNDTKISIIDVSDLAKGVYFLQVQSDNGLLNKKFIKD
jgi:hypothetical protein